MHHPSIQTSKQALINKSINQTTCPSAQVSIIIIIIIIIIIDHLSPSSSSIITILIIIRLHTLSPSLYLPTYL
jgi:hypothetical protein